MTPRAARPAVPAVLLAMALGMALWTSGCAGLAPPEPEGPLTGASLVEALREGGHVLYLRHAATAASPADQPDPLGDCTRQRLLDEAGRSDARALGEAVRRLEVPVGEVRASPYCRTVETAELAFGRVTADDALLPPEGDRERGARRLRALVSEPPDGGNTVLVGHLTNLRLVGRWSPDEGGTVVLRPDGDGRFRLVGEVPPQGWERLAERHAG